MSARAALITEKSFAIPTGAWSFPILSAWRDAVAGTAGGEKTRGKYQTPVGKKKGQETQVGLP